MQSKAAVINTIHLAGSTDWKLSESANIIYKQIHKTQFVAESDDHIKTAWMQCDAISFLRKFLVQLQIAATNADDINLQAQISVFVLS